MYAKVCWNRIQVPVPRVSVSVARGANVGDAGTHERSIPRLMNAVTVALNLVPTSTYTSLTCSSLAFPMLHLRRQSCNCFVVSRRAATVSCTLDPIYIQTVQIRRIRLMKQSVSTNVGAIGPVFRTSSVNRGRSVHVFCHDCCGDLSLAH